MLYGENFIIYFSEMHTKHMEHAVAQLVEAGRSRVRFPMVSLEFFIDIILLAALWHWGRLSV